MKTLATLSTLTILAISSISTAMPVLPPVKRDTRILSFQLELGQAKVSPAHIKDYIGGGAVINYANNTVSLKFWEATKCEEGMLCAQVLKQKEIELPIVDISYENECYVEVTAKEDKRPVDGDLQQIKIEDYSQTHCNFFVKPLSDVKYLTSYVNRKNGKTVTHVSTLKADLVDVTDAQPTGDVYTLVAGEYLKGFPKNDEVSSGSITIFEDTIHLEVYNKSNCPEGAMCLVGPKMIIADFKIESREQTDCEEVITAFDNTPGVGRHLVVKNYAHSTCETPFTHAVVAEYSAQIVAPKAKPNLARFYFDFIAIPFTK